MPFTLTQDFLVAKFKEYNEKYFNSELQMIKLRLATFTAKNGCFTYSFHPLMRVIVPVEIAISKKKITSEEHFRNTLVHEMVHYYRHCIIKHTKEAWEAAIKADPLMKKTAAKKIMESTDLTCHLGEWKKKADELNAKFPELHITRMSDGDEDFTSSDEDRAAVAAGAHALSQVRNGHRCYFIVDEETYKTIKERSKNKDDMWYGGEWKEFTLNKEEFAKSGLKPMNGLGSRYKQSAWAEFKRNGMISKFGDTLKESIDFLRSEGFIVEKKAMMAERKSKKCVWTAAELRELGVTESELAAVANEVVEIE